MLLRGFQYWLKNVVVIGKSNMLAIAGRDVTFAGKMFFVKRELVCWKGRALTIRLHAHWRKTVFQRCIGVMGSGIVGCMAGMNLIVVSLHFRFLLCK